jgi:uncharacterized protein (TIGR03000 family)
MRRALFAAVLVVVGSAAPAAANYPSSTTAIFPLLTPSGPYTNTYYYGWAYGWFANYNYAHGPYANWWYYGPYATYGWCGYGPYGWGCRGYADPFAGTGTATLVVDLPEGAVLKFNGVSSPVTGASRTFRVPALSYGQKYGYTLTAEVTVNGKTTARAVETVELFAGETTRVTLNLK